MLVKWITCWASDRAAFDQGQQAWAELQGVPGFRGQAGGWGTGTAQIFGFWSDPDRYRAFMERDHDRIAATQSGTFDQVRARVFDHRLDIGGGFPADLTAVALVRLAHCQVRPGRQDHFVRTQIEVWNPGMTAVSGMCGGVVAQSGDTEFLVLSAWRTPANHQHYLDEHFGALRDRAALTTDLAGITGDVITLEPAWTVSGRPVPEI
ncbi:hypothetical protein FB565_008584 [Actinoplanes lutulentus]|uniref:Uncharacterized protein DUF4937 n=1 Tax=Actinoplanes lutulentus TaxID=1287878 RepID=A0A327Z4N9_9ACTN|nr:DUF4937 domain-containing protein [Actinoplanes lutulentus]MBB2948798.1 hypothetical protein [Actinoplanes lutulentus]RAK29710.1 uncharacterized protein DUF4937 [Actinoplanes lutulentus]